MTEMDNLITDWEATHQENLRRQEFIEERLEPELARFDRDISLASIAISLKRIADALQPIYVSGAAAGVVDFQYVASGGHG